MIKIVLSLFFFLLPTALLAQSKKEVPWYESFSLGFLEQTWVVISEVPCIDEHYGYLTICLLIQTKRGYLIVPLSETRA
jgi:hypothetical protein